MFIEIIGLPGAGKTTLLKNLKRSTSFNFKTWKEIEPKAVRKFIVKENIIMNRSNIWNVFWRIPKLNNYFSKIMLQNKVKFSPSLYKGHWGEFADLLLDSVVNNEERRTETKPYYINLELEKIIRTQLTRNYCNSSEDIVILDEGMITAANIVQFDTNMYEKCLLPDAVIFLNFKPNIALKGIVDRRKKGRLNLTDKYKTDKEILNSLEKKYHRYIMQINLLKKLGIPVIEYNYHEISIDMLILQIERKLMSKV